MRKSFMKNTAPVLTGAVREENADMAIRAIKNFALRGARGIDLHLSDMDEKSLEKASLERIISESPLPVFALNYTVSNSDEAESRRIELLLRAFEAGASGIDIQGYTYDFASRERFNDAYLNAEYAFAKYAPREVVLEDAIIEKQCRLIDSVHALGGEILLSHHIATFMECDALIELARFLEKRKPDTLKFVTMCNTEYELAETVRAMLMLKQEIKTPTTLICNGKYRMLSRILNAMLGGYMVFCADTYLPKYANMGQPDITAIRTIIENADRLMLAADGSGIGEM